MLVANDIVYQGKNQPSQVETGGEEEQGFDPTGVHQGGEQVRQVLPTSLGNVFVLDVWISGFLHDSTTMLGTPIA